MGKAVDETDSVALGVGRGLGTWGVGDVADGKGVVVGEDSGVGSLGKISGLTDGLGAGLIATPLFQTNFLPDLMHVNFLPPAIDVAPTLEHLSPAFTAAKVGGVFKEIITANARINRNRFMGLRYQPVTRNQIAIWSEKQEMLITYCF